MSESPGKLTLKFETMNEADVREIIVRPLLHRLGYAHGTEANIRTEVTLKYSHAFLGRKNPSKDPILVGRADYICEVISYGRWVVEVKSPNEAIDMDTIQQAHTYAAHPEIGAAFIFVTNGRQFKLYRTGVLGKPLIVFDYNELENNLLALFNLVSPDAIRKLSNLVQADIGKPLGKGVASTINIFRGMITYEEHASDTPLLPRDAIEGLQLPVVGGKVERLEDGRIHAYVEIAKAAALFRDLSGMIGATDDYDFYSADEYISTNPDKPTIFQNIYENRTEPGKLCTIPGFGQVHLPFGFLLKAYTQAVGYVDGDCFKGTMRVDYEIDMLGLTPSVRPLIEAHLGKIPDRSVFTGLGSFNLQFAGQSNLHSSSG